MLEMTTFNARKNRWILAMPEDSAERDRTVMIAHFMGWTRQEIAEDWGISITRVQQIEKRGMRKQKTLAAQIKEAQEV